MQAIELGTGGWPGRDHLDDLTDMIEGECRASTYRHMVEDAGLTISALSCHANPLHPNPEIARAADELFRQTVRLAARMQVPTVVTFSGCPGDSDAAKHPNWVTTPWPPEFLEMLEWQWEKKAIPYWTGAARFAADHGVTVALEAHPGFLVYNVETLLKLRAAVGSTIGINFDPSHLFWQGVEIPAAIGALGNAIFHVHAKDLLSIAGTPRSTAFSMSRAIGGWASGRGCFAASAGATTRWNGSESSARFVSPATTTS